ncbi:MAG: cold shock and DUF1294 domain-containing protein [Tildeniella torsiva UHER 1998/13D]|jgi:uncharacterized membrane protein YsdA (DUF1294 family)/cold shock CspA family protein|nr:cold shock and DUF1294 domain-containing protein [Tildeniella torsiva UHER 1998/13D]
MKSNLCSGKLTKWNDDRGFGFIQPAGGGKDVFLHVSELKNITRRPRENDTICYHCVLNSEGKPRAVNAFIAGARGPSGTSPRAAAKGNDKPSETSYSRLPIAELLLLLAFPLAGATHFAGLTGNPLPLVLYPLMSVVTYFVYADDKVRAKKKVWRTSEQTLHFCELIGGWPGGFVAQQVLRHKSQKPSYQAEFWAIVVIHYIAWLAWLFLGKTLVG